MLILIIIKCSSVLYFTALKKNKYPVSRSWEPVVWTEYTQHAKRFRQRVNKNAEQKRTHKPVYTKNTPLQHCVLCSSDGYITMFRRCSKDTEQFCWLGNNQW